MGGGAEVAVASIMLHFKVLNMDVTPGQSNNEGTSRYVYYNIDCH